MRRIQCRFSAITGTASATLALDLAPLKWLRYSAFVVLYPLGFLSEVLVCLEGLPLIEARGDFSFRMPNAHNLPLDFPTTFKGYMVLAYALGAPSLFMYMLKQRRRQLGGAAAKTKNGD